MSEMKHTPGPWDVFIDDSGGEWTGWPLSITAPSVHQDCMVVRTGGQWPYDWDYRVSQAEAVANAKLISAAPDLLKVAMQFVSALDDGGSTSDAYLSANAAIRKATGDEECPY